ncbi:MAG TPA: rod shape-determining protein MreC [Bacteroidales bacterium]|nr:rod shape-determining protein MreC [Bacteroidales bacterium]
MRNLINFILKYHFALLFLILQAIAFFMLINSHQYQRALMVSSANSIAGTFYSIVSEVSQFAKLREANEQLAKENNLLLHITRNSFLITDDKVFFHSDTTFQRQYSFVNAQVINNSISRQNNFLTLNKGRRHGIEPNMGVITFNGIVGVVNAVSENFSTVISLLNQESNISARIVRNDHIGSLVWDGGNYRRATLKYIPSHVELSKGDTIVSSGYSLIFPPGILLGTVQSFEQVPGEGFISADIELSLDFNSLTHVSVVRNLLHLEQQQLQQQNATTP